ncbi:FtsJ-domain-containing protein [Epithele typhae]|uniref:FtsJ-domain-containing protein n=1 Tax=Epithele typhae TaxID=378194 RepID=UPI00200834E8|nr:FtsJ-domain-containing protein [Epithele typhae]KAH9944111.1 FtsJ-domain-containing protein [Epithele typhae]
MGKAQKKTGKGRLDKYYKLAKEQGYRARSAFKLIQLNKKYSFLESARCCIDLCAAPGGWLQVASKYMPVNSVIVGVDLVPIKPIPRVVTFAADITTTHCRNLIRNELKDWKADVVLHDGAPNVGTAWVQDAYSQSELVLMSLKLAAEFLIKGGTFVTKVFRSADYNNLIWVFNQLFGKVEATKPPSSRNVSAEIFVVCRDFLAPKLIDPKFFDPRHVFKDLTASVPAEEREAQLSKNAQATVFQPEKKRRHRDGYADGDYTLYKESGAADFIRCADAVAFLGTYNKVTFKTAEEKEWLRLDITTSDVQANCEDLRVLGKGDFKALLKWRTALREELGLEVKTKPTEELTETVEVIEDVDEEEQIQTELERLNTEAAARAKRERRRANEIKTRTIQRMQLRMTAPMDIGMEQFDTALGGHDDMFELDDAKALKGKRSGAGYDSDSEEDVVDAQAGKTRRSGLRRGARAEARNLEGELDDMYDTYQEQLKSRDAKYKVKEARRNNKLREEDEDDSDDEVGGWDQVNRVKARIAADAANVRVAGQKRRCGDPPATESSSRSKKPRTTATFDGDPKAALSRHFRRADAEIEDDDGDEDFEDTDDDDDEEEDADMDESVSEEEVRTRSVDAPETVSYIRRIAGRSDEDDMPTSKRFGRTLTAPDEIKQARIQKHGLLTAEATETRTELDGLPSWFLDDEQKHYKSNLPITKEAVAALRAKMRALDARPIKKVAEAKARKKFKAAQQLEKAMKKAEGVNETSDMTEREKAKQIEKVMQKGMQAKKRKEVKVVVAKGAHRGLKGRPKGVKAGICARNASKRTLAGSRAEAQRKGHQKAEAYLISLVMPALSSCICRIGLRLG